MEETSVTLLQRLRNGTDDEAWTEFHELYKPYLRVQLRRMDLQEVDVEDIVQNVLIIVHDGLPKFQRERAGSFHQWLKTITRRHATKYLAEKFRQNRTPVEGGTDMLKKLQQLEDPDSELSRQWDRDHDNYRLEYVKQKVEPKAGKKKWQCFRLRVEEGWKNKDVAVELNMSVSNVSKAVTSVLNMLTAELNKIEEI